MQASIKRERFRAGSARMHFKEPSLQKWSVRELHVVMITSSSTFLVSNP